MPHPPSATIPTGRTWGAVGCPARARVGEWTVDRVTRREVHRAVADGVAQRGVAAAAGADGRCAYVRGIALSTALPALITTLNSMLRAPCFSRSCGTWARMRFATESKLMPSVGSPQRCRATRYVS